MNDRNRSNVDFLVSREDYAAVFHFDGIARNKRQCPSWESALALAVARAAGDGMAYHVDVCCYSQEAADAFGCGEEYRDDPNSSVTQRVVIRAENEGRIP